MLGGGMLLGGGVQPTVNSAGSVNVSGLQVSGSYSGSQYGYTNIDYSDLGGNSERYYFGTFYAPVAGTYQFRIEYDDEGYMWVGSNAVQGNYDNGNVLMSGTGNGVREASVFLNKGFTPIRLRWYNGAGGGYFRFKYLNPGQVAGVDPWITDGTGSYYSNTLSGTSLSSFGGSGWSDGLKQTTGGILTGVTSVNFINTIPSYSNWEFFGYLNIRIAGVYTLTTYNDDDPYIWLGTLAESGWTPSPNNSQFAAPLKLYCTPGFIGIRYNVYNGFGNSAMQLWISGPDLPQTIDGTGYYFSAPA